MHFKRSYKKRYAGRVLDGPHEGDWVEEDEPFFEAYWQRQLCPVPLSVNLPKCVCRSLSCVLSMAARLSRVGLDATAAAEEILILKTDQFELYETIILTGQMPDSAVPAFLADNPDFATWYRERAERRKHG